MKKFLALLLTVLVLCSFVGCDKSNSSNPNNPNNSNGIWGIKYYVDEFNKPTDKRYITNVKNFYGSFSNSATTNSSLSAKIIIDPNGIYIILWEYGNYQVKGYIATSYKIVLQDVDGKKTNINGIMKKNSDRITVDLSEWETFVGLIIYNEKVNVYIEEKTDYGYSSTYLFTINQDNFHTVFNDYCL